MKTYKIVHRETLVGHFYVEANSSDEAMEKWNDQVNHGEIDFSDLTMEDSMDYAELDSESDDDTLYLDDITGTIGEWLEKEHDDIPTEALELLRKTYQICINEL